ncbi:MAG: PAS domain S-box protein [Desulfomonile tiedjei]|uniref:histidine kinase n=1 Tax=Desulfomonile tiedjei TaxID=2358 RepID=A0A9D6V4H5_9BACT|nr:PAS domain S-box protein [Desulfomonile tiedjei]
MALSDESLRERFGKLLDTAGQMFWELDRNFTVVYANDYLISIFGDPVGKTCHQFMAGTDEICQDCPVRKIFEGEERSVSERMRYDRNGNPIWLQHTATPIKNGAGEVIGASELTVDTTHNKNTEAWLRDSERLYRNLVEQVPDVIFSLDRNGMFSFVNTQVERFLGYPVQQILETPLRDYISPQDRTLVDTILQLQPEAIWDEEVAIVDARGNRKFARIRCKASFDQLGAPVGYEGVMRDRTVRRKLEEELKASKAALVEKIKIIDELYEHIVQSGKCKAIEEHTAEVAHELRQPLAIVGGFARRMDRQFDSGEHIDIDRQKQYAGIIVMEIQRLEKILDRLIDFTKRDRLKLQRINPNELIEYILGIIESRMKDKQLRLDVQLGPEIADIPLDPGRFQQLVMNLISNAIEASPIGGVIELHTGVSIPSDKALKAGSLESAEFFEIKIRNNGPVIPTEALQKIFNPFYTTKQHGTGLGLTVTKKIVEDHIGSISVKSDASGTVFTIWLPLTEPYDRSRTGFCYLEEDSGSPA